MPFDIVGINDIPDLPAEVALFDNYPNPFNASTVIKYDLPQTSTVTLIIYDLLGRHVATLLDGRQPAGSHSVTWRADNQPSGIYFYRLSAGETTFTKKLTLLK